VSTEAYLLRQVQVTTTLLEERLADESQWHEEVIAERTQAVIDWSPAPEETEAVETVEETSSCAAFYHATLSLHLRGEEQFEECSELETSTCCERDEGPGTRCFLWEKSDDGRRWSMSNITDMEEGRLKVRGVWFLYEAEYENLQRQ
jgi:hypothetical protein